MLTVLGVLRAGFVMRGPLHALAVGEGGQVGIAVDAHVEVLAPHAQARRAVATARPLATCLHATVT